MRWLVIPCCLLLSSCAAPIASRRQPLELLPNADTAKVVWVEQADSVNPPAIHQLDDPLSDQLNVTPERAEPTARQPADMITSKGVPYRVVDEWRVMVTAYNSEPGQTDDSPWRSANGRLMIPGYAANNGLPFGTAFRIPQLFGDQIFTVEDRMNSREPRNYVDVWMPSVKNARQFGRRVATMEILSQPGGSRR